MPIFEYKCMICDAGFERMQKKPDLKTKCPNCNQPGVSLVPSRCNAMFKGNGFYETDYKKKERSGE